MKTFGQNRSRLCHPSRQPNRLKIPTIYLNASFIRRGPIGQTIDLRGTVERVGSGAHLVTIAITNAKQVAGGHLPSVLWEDPMDLGGRKEASGLVVATLPCRRLASIKDQLCTMNCLNA